MKKLYLLCLLLAFILPTFAQMTIPRMYVQKLALDSGKNPSITWQKDKSANEYILKAWINTRPDEIISTETHPLHTIAVKQVGDGKKFPFTVVATLQLGNFRSQWKAGEVIHLEITHKKSGQKFSWRQPIPEGTALIKMLDKPLIIPPYKKYNK
ncbi:hypothetical protein MASR1M36_02670 [Candidatus Cloacimonadaceae bacterium]